MPLKPFIPLIEPLRFPKESNPAEFYEVAPVGIEDGTRLALALDPKSDVSLTGIEQQQILLGPTRDEILRDNVTPEYFTRVFLTAHADWSRGRATAEVVWETGADPKALEEETETTESEPSTSTGEATETQ